MEKKIRTYIKAHYEPIIGEYAILDVNTGNGSVETVRTTAVQHIIKQKNGKVEIITKNTIYKPM